MNGASEKMNHFIDNQRKIILENSAHENLSPGEVKDYRLIALEQILSSGHFKASERNKQFLKFVVEETVIGRASRIKAFTVAVDVFGRDASFDASVDPIVRIAAGHLRRSLEDYYNSFGKHDPVKIILPLGTYVPVFLKQERFPARILLGLRRAINARSASLQSGTVSITMALAGASAALAYLLLTSSQAIIDEKPVFIVENTKIPAEIHADSDLFTQSLWLALGEKKFRVVSVRPEDDYREVLNTMRNAFKETVPLYQLMVSFQQTENATNLFWHVLDGRTNVNYLSVSRVFDENLQEEAINGQLANEVAASLTKFLADE